MIKRIHLFAFFYLFTTLVATGGDPTSSTSSSHSRGTIVKTADGAYTNVSAGELQSLLANKTFPLINVHFPYEGEIAGTDALIPYNEIDRIVKILPADKAAMIMLYCRSGRMSGETSKSLVTLGYTNVWNLEGGMIEWKEAHLPIIIKKDR